MLTLVRHGQASFLTDDYDRLSPLGEEQSLRLGDYWVARGVTFDEVYTGPRRRQLRTCEIVGTRYLRAAIKWPVPTVIDELDEYDGDGIVRELLPALIARDQRFRQLAETFDAAEAGDRPLHFQRLFEAVTGEWVRGELEAEGLESWRRFHDRVRRAIERMTEGERSGRRVVAFTSGGPVSISVQLAARAPETVALELNWRIRNCALTEFIFTRGRITLDAFNAAPHLDERRLLTYR
jgi:broad specificity phosphatase PhoE